MAEPARQLPEEDRPSIRPQLGLIQGGGETSKPAGNLSSVPDEEGVGNNQAVDAPKLRALEGGGETSTPTGKLSAVGAGALGAAEASKEGGGLYKPEMSPKAAFRNLKWTKRKTVGSLFVSLLTGGALFGAVISTGPLEIIHLSQILQKSFSLGNSQSSDRLGHLFRYARAAKAGDIRLTRVSYLGSKVFGGAVEDLKASGIEFKSNALGSPTETTIDTKNETLRANNPELAALDGNPEAQKAYFADKIGVPASEISVSGNQVTVNQRTLDIKAARLATKSTVGLLDDGKIVSYAKAHFLNEAFGNPSALHPLDQKLAEKQNKIVNNLEERQAEKKAEADRQAAIRDPIAAEANPAVADAKSKSSSFNGTAAKVLLFTGAVCLIKSTADDVVKVNQAAVALPAAAAATNIIAIGAQIQDGGKDVTETQAKEIKNGLTDADGNTVFQTKSVQDLVDGNSDKVDNDIPADYKSAFSSDSTAANMTAAADSAIGGKTIADAACSPTGIVIQVLGSLALSAASTFGEAASAGTLTPAIVGVWAAKQGAQIALGAVLIHYLTHYIVKGLGPDVLPKTLTGPVGGAIYAYGSRYAANIVGIASGGIDLGAKTTTYFSAADQVQQDQQFRSESFFARIFDADDYRSLTGHLADTISPSIGNNLNASLSGVLNIGSALSGVFSSLLPRASAAPAYDWGFSQIAKPAGLIDDPAFADPYASADLEAGILAGSDGQQYIDKAMHCFGDKIALDTNSLWDVTHTQTIDPNSSDYRDAHCSDISDQNWQRTIMFVSDTMDMKGAACTEGDDDQSCADLGLGQVAPTTAPTTGGPVSATGTAAQLATQLLSNPNLTGNPGVTQDLTATSQGQTITNSDTCGKTISIDANLLQVLLTATSKYSIYLDNIVTGHGCDEFLHPKGRATDVGVVTDLATGKKTNFTPGTSNDDQQLDHDFYVYIASILPKGGEMGQDECTGRVGITEPPGITFFEDTCTHQHIDLGNP